MTINTKSVHASKHNLAAAAEQFATKGLAVAPAKERGKTPLTEHGCLDATKDLALIKTWWGNCPNANIMVATGEISGVFVVDIDGEVGEASLRAIEGRMGGLPPTAEVITGGGGRHLYYKLPDFDGAPIIKNSAGKLGKGLDVRGAGGYVIAPPSIHPSGRPYAWSVDSVEAFADPPVWLVALVADEPEELDRRRPTEHYLKIINEGAAHGARNVTAASLTGYLLRASIPPRETFEIVLAWDSLRNRPPMGEGEIARVVTSITKRELARRRGQ